MAPLTVDARCSNSFRSHHGRTPISEATPGIATPRTCGRLISASTTKLPAEFQTRRSAAQEPRSLPHNMWGNGTSELRLGLCKITHLEKTFEIKLCARGRFPAALAGWSLTKTLLHPLIPELAPKARGALI